MTAPAAAGGAAAYLALDAAYRAATARTSLAVMRALELGWKSVLPDNIAGSSGPWLADAIQIVLAGQRQTYQYANLYTDGVRKLAAPDAPVFTPPAQLPPNVEQIRTSLVFQGLATTAREVARVDAVRDGGAKELAEDSARTAEARKKQLMEEAFARVAATSARFVTTAGHEQIFENIKADPRARGWVRTTKPGCCFFCAMLASRGAVYKETSFQESDPRFHGPGNHKVHDSCGCGLRPTYSDTDPMPDRVDQLSDLWIDSQEKRKSGESAINAFRRIYSVNPLSFPSDGL